MTNRRILLIEDETEGVDDKVKAVTRECYELLRAGDEKTLLALIEDAKLAYAAV